MRTRVRLGVKRQPGGGEGVASDLWERAGAEPTLRFAFVVEQTLGHVAHSRNLERALSDSPHIAATFMRLERRRPSRLDLLPGFGTWSFQASLAARRCLTDRLRRGPLDAAFIHTQVAALLSVRVMRAVPTVVSLDATPLNFDSQGAAYGHRARCELIESLKRGVNRRALHRATALVTWSRWAAASLVTDYGLPEERVRVIPPGVDVELFRPAERRTSGPVRVLFVGGDFQRKGGPELLEAMRRLGDGAELDVVTGSQVTGVPPEVSCRIHRGLAPQSSELRRLYREADVFALPSRGDCMPQAVAEALASGLPVVAADVGAMREMVAPGVNGYLVPSRDVRALGAALETLAARPERRAAFGRCGRILAEKEHDARQNIGGILALMTRLARDREASSEHRATPALPTGAAS
jgi:glycosyltransferase involved in cell wall biosynthesis